MENWISDWLPGAIERGWKIAVFPVADGGERGVVVEPASLDADLRAELSNYE